MMEVELLRISVLRRYSIAAALVWSFGSGSEGNAQDASACWMIFSEQQTTYGRSSADEMICLRSQTSGEVIESTIFGSVGGCSKVTVNREGSGTTFVLDFSNCTNNTPKHWISCPSLTGETPKCIWKWSDNSVGDAYLRSCPQHWCGHGRDYGAK